MPFITEFPDPYIQQRNLLASVLDLSGSGWFSSGSTLTVASYNDPVGSYTLTNVSLDGEIRTTSGITTTQAGPICFSFSARAGTLSHVRPRLFDGTLVKQLSDPSFTMLLSGVWERYWIRGYVLTAGNVIYPYFRLGRSLSGDIGNIRVYYPVLEYGAVPSNHPLFFPETTRDPNYIKVREDYDALQTVNRTVADTATPFYLQLLDSAGNPKDCASQTMTFRMLDSSGNVVVNNRPLTSVDPSNGKFYYTFQSSEVTTAGLYTCYARRGSAAYPGNGPLFKLKLNAA